MTVNPKLTHQIVFHDLSEVEQESFIAGQGLDLISKTDFFLQETNLETTADNNLNLGVNESSSQSSKYKLSQITIGASFTFGIPKNNYTPHKWLDFLPNFLRNFRFL